MAEIDTKPFESVQAAVSLFEQKIDQKKYSSTSNEENEKDVDLLMRDLADCKLQLEIKESADMQAVLKLEVYHKTIRELSTQLKLSEADRDRYKEECKKAQAFISMLESEYKVITDQLIESNENHDKFLHVVDELKPMKEELLQLKVQLIAAEESKVAALRKAELLEKDVGIEKEKNRELLIHIADLNAAILSSKLAASEEEKERDAFFSVMEAELQIATETVTQSQEQLERMKRQTGMMNDLENDLLEKTILSDYLQLELKQAKELHSSEMELMEMVKSENKYYTLSIEAERKQMEEELQRAREKVSDLNCQIETFTSEMRYMKDEISKSNEIELELHVEIATLKSELHKGRSKIAAAEAAEARAMSSQSGLHLAVQQLALEAEAAKNEAQRLKLEMCSRITISVEEYESLIQKAKIVDDETGGSPSRDESQLLESGNRCEVDNLKEELEAANAEISDLRFTVEETMRRAELAEKAKAAVEDQLRKWREKQQQRRVASEALQDQSVRKHRSLIVHDKPSAYQPPLRSTSLYDEKYSNYVPLGKILNMKF